VTSALGESTWPEVDERGPSVVAVPLGSVEQHGPHLPLDTDTRIATALVDALAAARPDVVGAPPVAYGASGEHAGFPGTLSIGTEALTAVLVELGRSADAFAGVVFVNGHGGNLEAVRRASALLVDEGRRVLAWAPSVPDGDAHAGRTELIGDLCSGGVAAVAPNGVLGDPTGASADEGAALLAAITADLLAAVDRAFPR